MEQQNKLNIAFVSDYFYPNKGGVETHIRKVAEELITMGHNVIVITHEYTEFSGPVMLDNLLVYYLNIPQIINNTTLPTMFTNLLLFKEIYDKHNIHIVHGHQSLSNMCMEALFHASHLNIKTVLTDHSAFEIAKYERILVNNLTSFICNNVDWAICVSEQSKKNTSIRTGIPLDKISVIPNGIIPKLFYPGNKKRGDKIKLIYMSRLTYRKGTDLFIDALPLICRNKTIEVHIVGTGPKKSDLQQLIDENHLHSQIKIFAEVKYEDVGDILRAGDIFLNTSLTETFCLANLEAVCCGLIVVSTNVGGVKEVLQSNKSILFCAPTPNDIASRIEDAVNLLEKYDANEIYDEILKKYTWDRIAKETLNLYYKITKKDKNMINSLKNLNGHRNFLCRLGIIVEYLQIYLIEWFDTKYLKSIQ